MSASAAETDRPSKRQKAENDGKVVIKFRNYQPAGEELKESVIPEAQHATIDDEVAVAQAKLATEAKERLAGDGDGEVDLLNLAPQKIDWDLKRDIAPKLDKLERRTQRAIAELIRERLAAAEAS